MAHIQGMADILGCRIDQMPTVYLGMPLGNKYKVLEIWDGIIEKLGKKVSYVEISISVTRGQTYLDKCSVRFIANLCYIIISNPLQSGEEARKFEKGFVLAYILTKALGESSI